MDKEKKLTATEIIQENQNYANQFTAISDFASLYYERAEEMIEKELINKIMNKCEYKFAININEEKLLQWLKQAQEIENYNAEELQDFKIKHLLRKKDERIRLLEDTNNMLKDELRRLIEDEEN